MLVEMSTVKYPFQEHFTYIICYLQGVEYIGCILIIIDIIGVHKDVDIPFKAVSVDSV